MLTVGSLEKLLQAIEDKDMPVVMRAVHKSRWETLQLTAPTEEATLLSYSNGDYGDLDLSDDSTTVFVLTNQK